MSLIAMVPLFVYAGFFSKSFGIPVSADIGAQTDNSQTVALLAAVPNPDAPSLALGGGDIVVVDDSALLAESGPSGTIADVEEQESGHISIYVVREGDTLSQIADMFGVSINTIRWANDIGKNTSIQPGETLVILPISGVQHTVAEGDTLSSIADEYDGDLDEIANYNGLHTDAPLSVGSTIVIPNGEIATPVAPAPEPTYSAPTPSTSGPTYDGYYIRPINGGVRSQGLHGYNAVDLATYYGAQIFAAASGDVIVSRRGGWNGGYGNYLVIRHDNGTQTLYAHASQIIVSAGQHVVQGQVVGYIGCTGRCTGPHVHFEVRGARNPF